MNPIGLRGAHTAWPGRLQCFIDLSGFVWDLSALLEVKSLHIGYCLVDPANGRWITDCPLCSIPGAQVCTMKATNANLSLNQFLGSLGVTRRDVFVGGSENLNHFGADIALAIGQALAISWHCEEHSLLIWLVGLSGVSISSTVALIRRITGRCLVVKSLVVPMVGGRVVGLVVIMGQIGHRRSSSPHLLVSAMVRWSYILASIEGTHSTPYISMRLIILWYWTAGRMRTTSVAFMVLLGTRILMSTSFFVAHESCDVAIIASPSTWSHVSFRLRRRGRGIVRRWCLHVIVASRMARWSVVIVPTLVALVLIARTV